MVKGSEKTELKYNLTNIQLEYEMIRRKTLADMARSVYNTGKEFVYDHVTRDVVDTFKKETATKLNIKVNAQKSSLKAILLLFIEPYGEGARDSEKYVFPDLTKVSVTINGSPNMIYNNGIGGKDMWEEAQRFFVKEEYKTEHMDMTKFYTGDKFGLVIDLRLMADQLMHGNGKGLVKTTHGVQLEIEREAKGSGDLNCHVFIVSDYQLNIEKSLLESVET